MSTFLQRIGLVYKEDAAVGDGYELIDVNGETFAGLAEGPDTNTSAPTGWGVEAGGSDYFYWAAGFPSERMTFDRQSGGAGRNIYIEPVLGDAGSLYLFDLYFGTLTSGSVAVGITPAGVDFSAGTSDNRTDVIGSSIGFRMTYIPRTNADSVRLGWRPSDTQTQNETLRWLRLRKVPNLLDGVASSYEWSALSTTPSNANIPSGWTCTATEPQFSRDATTGHLIFDRNSGANLTSWMETTVTGLTDGEDYTFSVACGDHTAANDLNAEISSGANSGSENALEDGEHANVTITADGTSATVRVRPRSATHECSIKHMSLINADDSRLQFTDDSSGAP